MKIRLAGPGTRHTGRQLFPGSPYMHNRLCLASGFLPLDAENSLQWKRFWDELARCGMELILFTIAAI